MASMQKTKGSGYEREVAKYLSTLYGETFIRTIGSGAFIGGKNQARMGYLTENQARSHKGDITPPDSFYHANIECKFYQDFKFNQIFAGQCQLLDKWIEQVLEVEEENDVNIIFMKFNRKGQYVAYQSTTNIPTEGALHYRDEWYFISFERFFALYSQEFKESCAKKQVV